MIKLLVHKWGVSTSGEWKQLSDGDYYLSSGYMYRMKRDVDQGQYYDRSWSGVISREEARRIVVEDCGMEPLVAETIDAFSRMGRYVIEESW